MFPILKLNVDTRFYRWYTLVVLGVAFLLSILGHFLIGVTSKAVAKDLHFGDKACQYKNAARDQGNSSVPQCEQVKDERTCEKYSNCIWDYNGLGLDYQILAGPSYMAVYTTTGVLFGILSDRCNRVWITVVATIAFGLAVFAMGAATAYWHLVVLRMILAAGEAAINITGTGILSDMFRGNERALAMSIFSWGIYGGYGMAFPIGRYVPEDNILGLGWRACYYFTGIVAVVVGVVTLITVKEPKRTVIGEERRDRDEGKELPKNPWLVLIEPKMLLLCLASSIRQVGGITFAYNCDLFYISYYPGYDLGWPLFCVTVIIGSIGVVIGGLLSDKFVTLMGVKGRVVVLATSQLIAAPFAFACIYFEPLWSMITLGISYIFAEMWLGVLFATLVEIVPLAVRSATVGIFLFVMNNVGGNLPILVDPVSKSLGYREAMYIFFGGFYLISSVIFYITVFFMPGKRKTEA